MNKFMFEIFKLVTKAIKLNITVSNLLSNTVHEINFSSVISNLFFSANYSR